MKVHSIKGMRDILPDEARLWRFVEDAAREVFESFGYKEIRTPILEETALFRQGIGEGTDIVNKEMYTFTDRGGRSLTMRPEGTAPIVRSYIENGMSAEDFVKLYYMGPMFRSERPQKGRSRQFHQIGVEAIGSSNPHVDAEVIFMMDSFFRKLTLDNFKIKICSLGCAKDKEKLARGLRKFLTPEKNRLCEDCRVRLEKNVLRTLDCKVESCRALLRNSPKAKDFLCSSCGGHYEEVRGLLKNLNIGFVEDTNMVRGLDYYTNTVFEVTHEGLGAQDAIAAGGRYDGLIRDFGGKSTGAFGFALGMERLLMALSSEKKSAPDEKKLDVYAAATSTEVFAEAFKTVIALRRDGILCDINYDREKSLKAQMRQANRKNARLVAIFGDEEMKRGEVVLRDMKTARQWNVKASELAGEIKKGLDV